jgi:hypothetical protein
MKIVASILLVLALTLSGCETPQMKKEKEKKAAAAAAAKKAKVKPPEEATDVDFQAFVGRLRKAVAAHDVHMVASMMTPDFGYRLEPEASGEGVFQYWDEHGLWPELQGIISEKFVKKGEYMVAPPQFATPALNYDGYRAGIRRVNGSWKFAYFVNG